MRGPIDYIIVGFDNGKFEGKILESLAEAIDQGTIALVALSFIQKDAEGTVNLLNVADLGDEYAVEFATKYAVSDKLADEDDVAEVGELLENNQAAGLLAVEQLWAKPLKQAILDANGFLIAEGRIHPEAAQELEV